LHICRNNERVCSRIPEDSNIYSELMYESAGLGEHISIVFLQLYESSGLKLISLTYLITPSVFQPFHSLKMTFQRKSIVEVRVLLEFCIIKRRRYTTSHPQLETKKPNELLFQISAKLL
jgi:hypothetical protein